MELKGKLIEIFDTHVVTDKFQKREFVIEYAENPQYPELIKLEMIQDKCEHLDGYKIGETVDVSFNLKGRKWADPNSGEIKYFNTIQAWRMQKTGQPSYNVNNEEAQASEVQHNVQSGEKDDLPF